MLFLSKRCDQYLLPYRGQEGMVRNNRVNSRLGCTYQMCNDTIHRSRRGRIIAAYADNSLFVRQTRVSEFWGIFVKGSTHLASGILVALAGHFMGVPQCADIATLTGLIMGSVLPDIDKSTSIVGQRVPIIPKLFKKQHRGLTHSAVMVIGMYFISPAIAAGCLIHTILDAMNPVGVQFLWPIPFKFHLPLISIRSGKKGDKILSGIMWASSVVIAAFISLHISSEAVCSHVGHTISYIGAFFRQIHT